MPYLDRREPAVYVDIEDMSYAAETIETGRTVFSVILCDRGPSDQIVKIRSQLEFHNIFGKPNFLRTSQTHYLVDAALKYTGNCLVIRVVPDDASWANMAIKENPDKVDTICLEFHFTNSENIVTVNKHTLLHGAIIHGVNETETIETEIAKLIEGIWICSEVDKSEQMAQVVSVDTTSSSSEIILTLDRNYSGSTVTSPADIYETIKFESMTDINNVGYFNNPDGDVVYYFYANGAGKYYNRLVVRGNRNNDLEKYYLDENDLPKYKYMFMDIGVYEIQDNGNYKLLEGPWVVSLIPRYPDDVGQVIDPTTGQYIFIETIINDNSNLIRCMASTRDPITDEPNAEFPAVEKLIESENKRLQVMLALSAYKPYNLPNQIKSPSGIRLENGTDGTGQYNSTGNIQPNDQLLGKVAQAFSGQLTENGIDLIREQVYAPYQPDYIVCGGFPAWVQNMARDLSAWREDCITLADTGSLYNTPDKDIKARHDQVPWNTWTAMLYTQFRRITDIYTGRKFWITPVYHAIQRHLYCDGVYFLSEPVAGIEKGAIEDPIVLSYKGNHTSRGDLGDVELNVTIDEPDGIYFLTQFTTWKRYSVLKRGHVAKFVAYLKKSMPPLLKDLLQRKATQFWINQATIRVNSFLNNFLEGPIERYASISKYSSSVVFDEQSSTLDVYISIWPLRAIERINVTISVY